ncbi:proteoglycan 4 [Eurytemora carolleeae]|uniref:proteoglycan 4 n=1 Tax=Eurytemora carolleeae TaxID=1294199 RepID=UPI000C76E9D7|nr:proteoglycan 4 [Eurytemora carolleeae]|eukprot:XP_023344726.1 proteoglycan 4-like [Eurytemora affinis]
MSCIGIMYQPYSSSAHFTSSPTPSCSISRPTPLTSPSEASPALNHGKPTSPHASPAPLLLPEQGMKTENLEKEVFKTEGGNEIGPVTEESYTEDYRTPYTSPKIYSTPREPYSATREPYPTQREPYSATREPYSATREPYSAPREPYSAPREPYSAPREPYTAPPLDSREPSFPPPTPTLQEFSRIPIQTFPQEYTRREPSYHSPPGAMYPSPTPHSSSTGGSCGAPTPTPAPLTPVSPSNNSNDSEGEENIAPVYLARNVVVYTHTAGDVGSLVDLHFTKALDQSTYTQHKGTPMASRNLPPSFFNAHYHGKTTFASEYADYASLQHLAAHAQDPWQYAAQATGSSYHRSMHDLYSRSGPGYSLFINTPRLPVKTETPWSGGEYSTSSGEFPHSLDRTYSHPYHSLGGSEGGSVGAQDAKELYWPTF